MQIRQSSMLGSLLRAALVLLCMVLSLCPLESGASEQNLERVKIAFVYKFLSLIDWRDGAEGASSGEIAIGVAGKKRLVSSFSVLTDKFIRARRVSVQSIGVNGLGAERINVLYVERITRVVQLFIKIVV